MPLEVLVALAPPLLAPLKVLVALAPLEEEGEARAVRAKATAVEHVRARTKAATMLVEVRTAPTAHNHGVTLSSHATADLHTSSFTSPPPQFLLPP